jgi:hypothetical protein
MVRRITHQRGLSLVGMIFVTIIIVLVAVLGMKVAPEVIEYFKIMQAISATAKGSAAGGSVAEIRRAYERRVIVDQITSVPPNELEVTKDGSRVTLSFAYEKKISLFGPVSLLIEFEGSSDQ